MAERKLLSHFSINNPIYGMARISVWIADGTTGLPTQTLATLYSDPFSTTELGNPIALTGQGRWPQPVYVDTPIVLVATPALHEEGAGVIATYLDNVPPPLDGWGPSPG